MPPTDEPTARQAHRLLQELKIHQIELEMQNEQLRKSQADLEASRARFIDLYDFAPVGYCTISAAGLIVEINLTATTMLGVSRCKMIGRRLADFIFPDDQDLYFNHRQQLKGDGPQLKLELRLTGSGKLFFGLVWKWRWQRMTKVPPSTAMY